MELCPEHPKRDRNPKFTPLSETTSIPVCFIWESPPPPGNGLPMVNTILMYFAANDILLMQKLQVVIPGYCVAGTVGHKVLSGQKKIELDKKSVVSCDMFTMFRADIS